MSSLENFTPEKKLLIKGDLNQPRLTGINVVNPQTGNSYININKIVLTLEPDNSIICGITYYDGYNEKLLPVKELNGELKTVEISDVQFDLPGIQQ